MSQGIGLNSRPSENKLLALSEWAMEEFRKFLTNLVVSGNQSQVEEGGGASLGSHLHIDCSGDKLKTMAQERLSLERFVDLTVSEMGDGLDFNRHLVVTFKESQDPFAGNHFDMIPGKGKDKAAGKISREKHAGSRL